MDYERLRDYLKSYIGSGTTSIPELYSMLYNIEVANEEELVSIAIEYGVDLNDFKLYRSY